MTADRILPDIPLTGLTADSRQVRPGYLFAAIPGTVADGAAFISDAVAKGAVAVLAPPGISAGQVGANVTLVTDANPRRRLARMAAAFYAPQPDTIVGVTGTSGKSSVAGFTRQIWAATGLKAASIGTLGIEGPGYTGGEGLTTPDATDLHRELAEMAQADIDHVAMEASSHGLDQYRLDGVRFSAAAFTNLSHEHLDYHPTMEAYRQAKMRLFEDLLTRGGSCIVNTASAEHDHIAAIAQERGLRMLSYGLVNGAIRCIDAIEGRGGYALTLDVMGDRVKVDFPLPGKFQLENALAALGLVIATGTDGRRAAQMLSRLEGVRGRMQLAGTRHNGARIFVDYAHKAEALKTVLNTLRPFVKGRLVVVFGCGGDRDRGKRPIMGKYAAEYADQVIVTDDNPRTENAAAIRAEVMQGCPDATEIGDRAAAIAQAVSGLTGDDILLIAGKGHETGQKIGTTIHPFDDVVEAKKAISLSDGTAAGGGV
ncbi:MAG: UDP-N-acetylmuramoyl-L-alanyl-D-glutamate--2,6-diaminopimelate ligase [Rhodospirillaceae bacterium]|nr:UDP-N-acetylmuramoyl-L-alanyl-D-glutamate--2,6-diaminopimelate ligase [Rhodospirillaceae bacterium]MAX64147.1 UDP-N-acetylmuramoyl-L-alanyl-D-glutamate--2,6-diaminopimelate ligase [Rhodospirillaceae bacterium]MBB57406.1 UDP-N-acetylmuramoyl-L-alanyl-D-glutamate--2,6-diaminopimelate ligase [Rhodospirillaceae bacterium]|tara:strand:- start:5091 stop:6542 length:1452 start_codon:yes stop_codon:yes gene_type:complete